MNIPKKYKGTIFVLVPTVLFMAVASILFSHQINQKTEALVKENHSWAEKAGDAGDRLFFFSWMTIVSISLLMGYAVYRSLNAIAARYAEIAALAQKTVKENYII